MYQRKIPIDYNCGLTVALEVVGSKWKFCLLDEISKGITRPRDLLHAVKGITRRDCKISSVNWSFMICSGRPFIRKCPCMWSIISQRQEVPSCL
jgi:hypothetical protein